MSGRGLRLLKARAVARPTGSASCQNVIYINLNLQPMQVTEARDLL